MNSTMETYHGHVRTPADAIILFEACRLGLLPRVQRRLSEKERQGIKSGSVFVWDEQEAGMRRWTDGKSWSASRVSGSFLTYREMEGKRGGGSTFAPPVQSVSQRKSPNGDSDSDHLDPDGPDGYRYKPDGLVKQSFSITTSNGQKLHLISYYSRAQPHSMQLLQPTLDSRLKDIRPPKGMYPESTVHEQQNVPVMAAATSAQQPRQQVPTTLPPYQPHPNAIPQQPTYRTQGAPHPHSYAPPPHMHGAPYGHPHQQQQWLPSPTVTPPISMAGPMHSHYPTQLPVHGQYPPQLPPPIASQNSAMHYALQGTPLPVFDRSNDGSPQMPPVHRGQMPSPIMHLRNHDAHQQGYSGSPASGAHSSITNTPPRSNDGFEINPIRGSPDMRLPPQAQQLPPPQHIQPHLPGDVSPASRILDVQDIPAGRITSNEEMRMLRMLDKAFVA